MGYFNTPEEAGAAYDAKAVEIHGRLGECGLVGFAEPVMHAAAAAFVYVVVLMLHPRLVPGSTKGPAALATLHVTSCSCVTPPAE
jgi:hypothetical protein